MCLASSRFWITSTTVMLATPLLWIDEKGTQMFYDTTGGTVGDKKSSRSVSVVRPFHGFYRFHSVFVPLPFYKRAAFARCKHVR